MGSSKEYGRAYYKKNRERMLSYGRRYYRENPEKFRVRARRSIAKRREMVYRAKTRPCMDCGVQHNPWVMQFDHRPGEKKLFGLGMYTQRSVVLIQAEIAKCDVVCANCHAERTYKRKAWQRQCVPRRHT